MAIPPRTIRALDEWLTSAARARPDHPALVAEGRSLTYAELDAAASRAARRVAALGVEPGDRVATTLPPSPAFAELLHGLPRLGAVLVPLDPRAPARVEARLTVDRPLEGAEADVPLRSNVDPEQVHSVILTSGTAGPPKEVELTYGNHEASALASAERLGLEAHDRWLCPLPLFHVGGLAILLRSAISGSTTVLHDGFDAARVRAELEGGHATLVSLVPTMLGRLLDAGLGPTPRLKAVLLGGGPIPEGLVADTGLPVVATYGMTETASHIATRGPGEAGARPLAGVELQIGEEGEVLVRGPMVAPGALAADGWLHTGDRGRLEDGLLHVAGRLKELIVTGGENVSPVEVEQVLMAHPAVRDAAVAGLPDREWGEAVTAFVVLDDHASAEELIDWCRERLAPYKVPKRVEQVADLPRNAAGKLLRDQIVL